MPPTEEQMERDLWVLGRPVNKVRRGSMPAVSWGARFSFSHWGLLCTELTRDEIEYWTDVNIPHTEHVNIGMIYELSRNEHNVNSIMTTTSVSSTFRLQWSNYIKQYIGRTTLTDLQIMEAGIFTPSAFPVLQFY